MHSHIHFFSLTKVAANALVALCLCVSSAPLLALSASADYRYESRYSPAGLLLAEISPDADEDGERTAKRYHYELADRPTLVTAIEHGNLKQWYDETVLPSQWGPDFEVEYTQRINYDEYGRKTFEGKANPENEYQTLKQFNYDERSRVKCETVRMNENALTPAQSPSNACTLGSQGSYGEDRITKYEYDHLDNVTKITKAYRTDYELDYATYTYGGYLKTSVTDANGNYTKYEYDDLRRLEYVYYPSKDQPGEENPQDYDQFGYDANGNRTSWRRRNGKTITYEYDALNRMWLKNIPDSTTQDVYYEYELTGVNTTATFGGFSGQGVYNEYNGFGDLLSSTSTMNGSNRTLTYANDQHGNREYLYHPDGKYVRYFYDQLDRTSRIQANGSTVAWINYDALGQLDSVERNYSRNGATTALGYDETGRVSSLSQDFTGANNDLTNSYTYNPASQITSNHYSNDQYIYAGADYRTGPYSVNGLNQYTEVNGDILDYDDNGNLTQDDSTTYVYDVENRLTAVTGGNINATLTYDPLGRLFEVHVTSPQSSRRQFLYDGDALVAEYTSSASTTPTARYVHGDGADVPLVQFSGSAVSTSNRTFLHSNHQGSIIAHSNYNGDQTALNTYDEFGIPELTNQGRFGYTGQVWLPELGLYHYKARMYEPRLGRFLQTDPVGYEDQMNLYAYVHNDPLNYVDPTGKQGESLGRLLAYKLMGWDDKKIAESEVKIAKMNMAYTKEVLSLGRFGTFIDFSELVSKLASGDEIAPLLSGMAAGEATGAIIKQKYGAVAGDFASALAGTTTESLTENLTQKGDNQVSNGDSKQDGSNNNSQNSGEDNSSSRSAAGFYGSMIVCDGEVIICK